MRADQLLVERGFASSRSQAQRMITSGVRWRLAGQDDAAWKTVARNRDELADDAEIDLLDGAEARYVSRGGLKLEGALRATGIAVEGKACLDVGQSTGGFTDCLLQQGASHVTGVDVGQGQLHAMLRDDARVTCIESVNARTLSATDLIAENDQQARATATFDLIVGDLSFISQTLVLPALVPLLTPAGDLLMLVKPQFELQPGQVGKGGIVKEPAFYTVVETRIRDCCAALGLRVVGWHDSPITGGDGNREFFVHARRAP
ncbi:MAG: TlyA family RNA methyltransferase [Ramlibacter sp.]